MPTTVTPADVLDFWLADGLSNWRAGVPASEQVATAGVTPGWPSKDMEPLWFSGGAELDEKMRDLFGAAVAQAVGGELKIWEAEPHSRLALVILLDQFTRNIYRGSTRAFSGDPRAQQLVVESIAQGGDLKLPWVGQVFMYMPLMHAEELDLQRESVRCFTRLVAEAPEALRAGMEGRLRFAVQHHDIVARFGRFPHRNTAQGRTSTALEFDFLKNGPRFGQ